jgi:hypothetical protein
MNTWVAPKKSYRFTVFIRNTFGGLIGSAHFDTEEQLVNYMKQLIAQGTREGVSLVTKGVERRVIFEEYTFYGNLHVAWDVEGNDAV